MAQHSRDARQTIFGELHGTQLCLDIAAIQKNLNARWSLNIPPTTHDKTDLEPFWVNATNYWLRKTIRGVCWQNVKHIGSQALVRVEPASGNVFELNNSKACSDQIALGRTANCAFSMSRFCLWFSLDFPPALMRLTQTTLSICHVWLDVVASTGHTTVHNMFACEFFASLANIDGCVIFCPFHSVFVCYSAATDADHSLTSRTLNSPARMTNATSK